MRTSSVVQSWLAPLALAALIGGGLHTRAAFREDEVQCEETVAHLESCCPNFDPGLVSCEYVQGCSSACPDLDATESRELRELDCAELRNGDHCERVLAISDGGLEQGEEGTCP